MERKIIIQKIKLTEKEPLTLAYRYYSLLSAISNVKLTEREIQLMSFLAIKGNISYSSYRDEFIKMYKSSSPTINNIISKLKKSGLLIKSGGKVKVNPNYLLDFTNDITVQIAMEHGQAK